MVDFIVEDGTGVLNANSLVTLEYADAYFAEHPFYAENWAAIASDRRKIMLKAATREICGIMAWGGTIVYTGQALPWPRYNVINPEGSYYGTTTIPANLKQAICEQAYWLSTPSNNPDAPSESAGIEELKIDVIEIKFAGSEGKRLVPVAVARLLRGLGASYNGGRVRRVQVSMG